MSSTRKLGSRLNCIIRFRTVDVLDSFPVRETQQSSILEMFLKRLSVRYLGNVARHLSGLMSYCICIYFHYTLYMFTRKIWTCFRSLRTEL